MMFHEKLYKLRKEKAWSQEALAEKLGTTRQAVSKWENGQGFPETETLLLLGNLFNVSVDFMLKDTDEESSHDDRGYYVSKEMAEGYFANQKKWLLPFILGVAILIISMLAYLKFDQENTNPILFVGLLVVGGCSALKGILSTDKKYQVLEKEPLIFDSAYLKALKSAFEKVERNYRSTFIVSLVIFMVSVCILTFDGGLFSKDFSQGIPNHVGITIFALAGSASAMFYSGTMAESYSLLADNEKHSSGFWFKLSKKIKRKTDDFLRS